MCGICGILSRRPGGKVDPELLRRMSGVLRHRGPDDAGAWSGRPPEAPAVLLAMRRLAVIDLETGRQPITNEDESAWIVFNGEIYNHRELRVELEARGHRFRTRSDTETILHAYEEYGPDCVRRLRGMFAFAVWDERRERLLLARDPVGIKPLFWTETGERFLFASEIKALLEDPAVPRRVNHEGLHHYLSYLYVPAPQTMFEGIHQLPPGHRLVWERGAARIEEYWPGPAALLNGDAGEPVEPSRLWEVLRESVAAHMISDVPLGAFLSGGLDSTLIVALMAELSSRPVRTFTVGFTAAGLYNEMPHAREVAEHLGTEHHELDVEPESVRLLPEIIRFLDEPLADASVIPNYMVAGLARRHVTVALTGIGGDELFGGYRRYFGDAMAEKWRRVPRPLRRNVLLPALRLIPASGDTRLGDATRLVQKFLEPLDLPAEQRYLAWNAFFTEPDKARLYAGAGAGAPESSRLMEPHFARVAHRPFADRAMFVDTRGYLPGDPLCLSDRMTMAHSLEARVPFVDVEVMEFAARLPLAQKLSGRNTKVILRQALAGRVPERIIHRPKQGFGTPIDLWLRRELSGLADRVLAPELLRERGFFRPEYVAWLREQHASGKRDFSQHLWALLVFELWHRTYIDASMGARQGLTLADLGLDGGGGSPAPVPPAPRAGEAAAAERVPARPLRSPPRPLRVLMVADVDPVRVIGGAERMLSEHCTRLAARGHRVVVLTRREEPGLPPEEEYRGVRVVRHPVGAGRGLRFLHSVFREGGAAFSRLLAQEEFDLLNVFQPLAGAAALARPESRGVPVLYTYLSPWSDEYRVRLQRRAPGPDGVAGAAARAWVGANGRARERIELGALRRSNRMLVLSEFSASQLAEIHGISPQQVSLIPGGVDTGRFRPPRDRDALRRDLGLPRGPLLLTVRNLVARMGLDALVEAMVDVAAAVPGCRLLIGGTGPLRQSLEQQARALGLEETVRFLGFIPEDRLPDYYGAADAFVLPTRCLEGFGLVTVEALACGTPVFGTPVGGTLEILRAFESSHLFSGPDAADMARLLLSRLPEIAGDESLRDRCRRFVLDHYSWDVLIPRLEELMYRVAGERVGRAPAPGLPAPSSGGVWNAD